MSDQYERAWRELYDYVVKLKEEVDSQQITLGRISRPWYRDGAVMFAALAFFFSLGTTTFSYFQAEQQRVHNLRTEVRATLVQYNQLATEVIRLKREHKNDPNLTGILGDKYGGVLELLAVRASELAMEIPDFISPSEHLSIAVTAHSADRETISIEHLAIALKRSADPEDRVKVHRMLGIIAAGHGDEAGRRRNFQIAVEEASSVTPDYQVAWSRLMTLEVWADHERESRACDEFERVKKLADEEFLKLPLRLQVSHASEFALFRTLECPPATDAYRPTPVDSGGAPP